MDTSLNANRFDGDSQRWTEPNSQSSPLRSRVKDGHITVRRLPDEGSGDEAVETDYALTGTDVTIGRSPGCDVPLLSDPLVSRRQVLLTATAEGYEIVDLGSANGTVLNGVPLDGPAWLLDGDVLTLGRYTISASSEPARPAAAPQEPRTTIPLQIYPFEDTGPRVQAVDATTRSDESNAVQGAQPAPDGREQRAEWPTWITPGPGLPAPAPGPSGDLDTRPPVGGTDQTLDTLQSQLVDMIQALRRQADDHARIASEFRQALVGVHHALGQLLDERLLPSSAALALDLDSLVGLARDTGSNPRHLDYMLGLTEHADELALTVEAVQRLQGGEGIIHALQTIQALIDSALA